MGARLHGVKGIEQMLQSKAQFVKAGQLAPIGRMCPGYAGKALSEPGFTGFEDWQDSGVSTRWVICGWLRGGSRNCFHKAAAPEPGGEEALRRYDDNGNGRISGAEARGHGMARVESGGMGRVACGVWGIGAYGR